MPRKKHTTTETKSNDETKVPTSANADMPAPDEPVSSNDNQSDNADITRPPMRTFKSTVSFAAKGVRLGVRDGHDWVISFPEDPGSAIKAKLIELGFLYRDKKWKLFTNATNRKPVEALAKELNRQFGEEVRINDYSVKQVVLAFEGPPGEEVTARLREAGFYFRTDLTWNADFSAESQKFARELIQSLPDQERSAAAER